MLIPGISFAEMWRQLHGDNIATRATIRFIHFLENRLGANFLYDATKLPYEQTDLIDLFELAAKLRDAGVIHEIGPIFSPPDEPHFHQWRVECATSDKHAAGGMAMTNERDALIPALAEAVERYIWMTKTDYFESPQSASSKNIVKAGHAVLPESFTGYSEEQRIKNPWMTLRADAEYLWTKGHSHSKESSVWIPVQVVNGTHRPHNHEPMILQPITTGLATGPTKKFALLNGALEILERDAFMITWLNQLTPPRIDIEAIANNDPMVRKLITLATRYRLSVSAVSLPTDAPTHAVCAIVRDDSGERPNVTVGLKAHRSLRSAITGATLEALRIRQTIRFRDKATPLDPHKPGKDIVHLERAQYWGAPGSADKLAFLTSGPVAKLEEAVWENDTLEEHWSRIVNWCKESGYECASVDVGRSKANVSPWQIQMVVMPEMQPMHQTEKFIYLGGKRLRSVPEKFGYTPRLQPYADEPHPFA